MMLGTRSWLNQTITRYPHTGFSDYGQSTYGASNTIPCQIIQRNQVMTNRDGMDVTSTSQILIDGSETIHEEDKIVLPDSSVPYIIAVKTVPNPRTGTAYFKIIYT